MGTCNTRVEEFNWAAEANGVVGAALWPRSVPHRVRQLPNGEIGLAAATTPNGRLVEELMATLLRVRQAEFASAKGYKETRCMNLTFRLTSIHSYRRISSNARGLGDEHSGKREFPKLINKSSSR